MSGFMEEMQRERRQSRSAMAAAVAGTRAPFILIPHEDGGRTLVDTAAIRWVGEREPPDVGAAIQLHSGEVLVTPLTVTAVAALLSESDVVVIDLVNLFRSSAGPSYGMTKEAIQTIFDQERKRWSKDDAP